MNKRIIPTSFRAFVSDESAQSAVEYVLLAFILITASYGAVQLFQKAWQVKFNKIKQTRAGFWGMFIP